MAYSFHASLLLQTNRNIFFFSNLNICVRVYTHAFLYLSRDKNPSASDFHLSFQGDYLSGLCHWSPVDKSLHFYLVLVGLPKFCCIPGQRLLPLYQLQYLITYSTSEGKEEATVAKISETWLSPPTHFRAQFYPNTTQRSDVLSCISLFGRVYLPTAAIPPGGNLASLTHRPRQ